MMPTPEEHGEVLPVEEEVVGDDGAGASVNGILIENNHIKIQKCEPEDI